MKIFTIAPDGLSRIKVLLVVLKVAGLSEGSGTLPKAVIFALGKAGVTLLGHARTCLFQIMAIRTRKHLILSCQRAYSLALGAAAELVGRVQLAGTLVLVLVDVLRHLLGEGVVGGGVEGGRSILIVNHFSFLI